VLIERQMVCASKVARWLWMLNVGTPFPIGYRDVWEEGSEALAWVGPEKM